MLLSHHQNACQNQDIKTANKLFENATQFKYLGMAIKNQNLIQEGNKIFNSGNACYHSVQNLLSSHMLSKTINNENISYKTVILPVVPYWCEAWSLTLMEEHRLRVFEKKVLRRIIGLMRDEVAGRWRELHNKELRDLYSSPSIITMNKSRRMRWVGHVTRIGGGGGEEEEV
jgi:hypothetical protein